VSKLLQIKLPWSVRGLIELYDYGNYDNVIGKFPVESGSVNYQISGSYTLDFTVRNKVLKDLGITLSPFSVFKYDGRYYRQTAFSSTDKDIFTKSVSATDLFTLDMIEKLVGDREYTGHLLQLLEDEIFVGTNWVINPPPDYFITTKTITTKLGSALTAFQDVCKAFRVEYAVNPYGTEEERFTVYFRYRLQFETLNPLVLRKGHEIDEFSETVDTTNVTTVLAYSDKDGSGKNVIYSQFRDLYPKKDAAMRFDSEKGSLYQQAVTWLTENDQPKVQITITTPISVPKIMLGRTVVVTGEQADFPIVSLLDYAPNTFGLRVINAQHDITRQSNSTYQIGNNQSSFGNAMAQFVSNNSKNEGGGGERFVVQWLSPTVANFDDVVEIQSRTTLVIFMYENIYGVTINGLHYPTISTNLTENYWEVFPNVLNNNFSGEFENGLTPGNSNASVAVMDVNIYTHPNTMGKRLNGVLSGVDLLQDEMPSITIMSEEIDFI
jgi:hypothetical protein